MIPLFIGLITQIWWVSRDKFFESIAKFFALHLGYWGKEMSMWKWAVIALCGFQAVWAAHYVVENNGWSIFAVAAIIIDILVLLAVTKENR